MCVCVCGAPSPLPGRGDLFVVSQPAARAQGRRGSLRLVGSRGPWLRDRRVRLGRDRLRTEA